MAFQEGEKVQYLSAKCGGWVNGCIQAVLEDGELIIDIRNPSSTGKVIKGTVHVKPDKIDEKVKNRKGKAGVEAQEEVEPPNREEPEKRMEERKRTEPTKRAQPARGSPPPEKATPVSGSPPPASSSSAAVPRAGGEQSARSESKDTVPDRTPPPAAAPVKSTSTQRKIQNRKTERPASQSWADMSRDEDFFKEDWPAPSAASISISSSSLRKVVAPESPAPKGDGDLALRKKASPVQTTPRSKRSEEMAKELDYSGPKVSAREDRRKDREEKKMDDWMRRRMEEPEKGPKGMRAWADMGDFPEEPTPRQSTRVREDPRKLPLHRSSPEAPSAFLTHCHE
jgi:hypothetical protein